MGAIFTRAALRLWVPTLLLVLAGQLTRAQGPAFQWAVTCGVGAAGQTNIRTQPNKLVVDAQGNSYVAGYFFGTVTIGSTSLTSAGLGDVFVAKLDAQGSYLWVASAGGTEGDGATCLALDGAGEVYVGGSFNSYSLTCGPGAVLYNSSANSEAFVAKLDAATGQWQWARRAGGTGAEVVQGLAVSSQGEVAIAGEMASAAASFGPTVLACDPASGGLYRQDVFVAKLSSGGAWLWAVRAGGGATYMKTVGNLVVDATGFLYLAGTIGGTLPFTAQFGGSTLVGNYTGTGVSEGYDGYVAKLDAGGAWRWAVQGDAAGRNLAEIRSLASDGQGHLYVGGKYASTAARIGAAMLPNQGQAYPPLSQTPVGAPPTYHPNAFVAQLDAATGAWGWAVRAGGGGVTLDSQVLNVAADGQGRVYVTGYFEQVLPVSTANASAAQLDGATGIWRWADNSLFGTLATDGFNRVYMGSYFYGYSATYGSFTLSAPGANYITGVVARLGPGVLAATSPVGVAAGLQVWPNPSGSGQPVQVAGAAPGAVVQVLDVLGRLLQQGRMPATGPLQLALPASLASGLYVVRSAGQSQRLLVE